MPRSHPPRSIKLLLPSTASSSSTASKAPTVPGRSTEEANFEVLLHAQKLAAERGQYLDIMSFMNPVQQQRYLSSLARYRPLPATVTQTLSAAGQPLLATDQPSTATVHPSLATEQPLPDIPPPLSESLPAKRPMENEVQEEPALTEHPPTPPITVSSPVPDSPSLQPAPKKPRPLPDLSHLHWKQRQKRLAMLAAGEISEDSELLQEKEKDGGTAHASLYHGKGKEGNKEAIQSSASHWNHLLIQARKARGPQWDYNTQSYQIDRSSTEYYTHMSKPEPKVEAVKIDPSQTMRDTRGMVNGHEYQTPGQASMRTPSTGKMEATPRITGAVNGHVSQQPRLLPHLQASHQQYTPSPPLATPSHQQSQQFQQTQYRQHQQPPQQNPQFQSHSQPQPYPQSTSYQDPQTASFNPTHLARLQLAQMGGMNPAMLSGRPGEAQTSAGGTNLNSIGGMNLAALSGLPGMGNMGRGGGSGSEAEEVRWQV